jgi:hypothetical protein
VWCWSGCYSRLLTVSTANPDYPDYRAQSAEVGLAARGKTRSLAAAAL